MTAESIIWTLLHKGVSHLFIFMHVCLRQSCWTTSCADTMYKKRVQTSGGNNCISKGGFRNFVKACPGLSDGHAFDVDYAFMQNLGYTDPKKPKFELNFEQFLDAIAMVATAK